MKTWLRAASFGVAAGVWLHGQEVGEDRPSSLPTYMLIFAVSLGLCAHWLFLSWLTRRRLSQTGWRATRVVWPTAAMGLALLTGLWGLAGEPDSAFTPAVAVNLPLLPVVWLISSLSGALPPWVLMPAAIAAGWLWWWAIIGFFEWRARNSGPVTLGI